MLERVVLDFGRVSGEQVVMVVEAEEGDKGVRSNWTENGFARNTTITA